MTPKFRDTRVQPRPPRYQASRIPHPGAETWMGYARQSASPAQGSPITGSVSEAVADHYLGEPGTIL